MADSPQIFSLYIAITQPQIVELCSYLVYSLTTWKLIHYKWSWL